MKEWVIPVGFSHNLFFVDKIQTGFCHKKQARFFILLERLALLSYLTQRILFYQHLELLVWKGFRGGYALYVL